MLLSSITTRRERWFSNLLLTSYRNFTTTTNTYRSLLTHTKAFLRINSLPFIPATLLNVIGLNWASWPRNTFIEHWKIIYPQISNVADKTFLAIIKDLKFECDLDDISVATRFPSELRKITDHYDTRTRSEEVKAVKLLMQKINVVKILNYQPYFDAMALQCDIKMPIAAVKDFRLLIQHTIGKARKIRIQAENYGFIVLCCH